MVAIIAIAGSMVYYYVFFKPEIAKAEIRLQEQKFESDKSELGKKALEEAIRKENLDKSLKEADEWYDNLLEGIKKDNISIGIEEHNLLWKMYQDKRDDSYKRYGK